MKNITFLILLITVFVISSCAQNTQIQQPTPSPPGEIGIKKDIEISGFAFNPAAITVPVGATVIWTNKDSVSHSIVSDTGNEINSGSIPNGGTYAHTSTNSGNYDYHCGIHPSMKGTIKVE